MNRKGFSAVFILIIILAVLIAAVILYSIWHPPVASPYASNQALSDSYYGYSDFSESSPPDKNWDYLLDIYPDVNSSMTPAQSFATLYISGFRTDALLTASIKQTTSGTLDFFFESASGTIYSGWPQLLKGDPLFSLKKDGENEAITWYNLSPMISGDLNSSVFTKISASHLLSSADVIAIVSNLASVKQWEAVFTGPNETSPTTGGTPVIGIDSETTSTYEVQAYEDMPDHDVTFGWYNIDKTSGVCTEMDGNLGEGCN
jgi:hypothetical protein